MARRISEQERVELFFIGASFEVARLTYDRITLILRTKGVIVPVKRTRKTKTTGEKTNG